MYERSKASDFEDLTCYAVFNLKALYEGVLDAVKRDISNGKKPVLLGMPVGYGDPTQYNELRDGQNLIINSPQDKEFLESVFVKPRNFSVENEVRLMLRSDRMVGLPLGAEPLYLDSDKIKKSIVKIDCM